MTQNAKTTKKSTVRTKNTLRVSKQISKPRAVAKSTNSVKKESGFKVFLKAVGLIILPLLIGGLSALTTSNAMSQFGQFNQPPLSPPAWLFPVAWTILYILMGIASFLIYHKKPKTVADQKLRRNLLLLYFVQLVFNFFWSILFFTLSQYWFAFVWLIAMWIMIIVLIVRSFRISKAAAILFMPYFLWTTFAAYLNIMIAILN